MIWHDDDDDDDDNQEKQQTPVTNGTITTTVAVMFDGFLAIFASNQILFNVFILYFSFISICDISVKFSNDKQNCLCK